jgi:Icc-related predicted phosphoesterase
MKIWHISDTHGMHHCFQEEPDVDVIIHSGDCSNWRDPIRNTNEVRDFIKWYEGLKCPNKIYVAGNHDTSIERRYITPADFASAGITYLENSAVFIGGLKFYGSPITPTFGEWAFMKARHKTHAVWEAVPDDTDVLVVHGPPKGVRDLSFDMEGNLGMCGDLSLTKRCWALRDTLKLVCFGHIHNMKDIDTNQGIAHYSHTKTVFSNAACVYDGRFDQGLTSFGNIITI